MTEKRNAGAQPDEIDEKPEAEKPKRRVMVSQDVKVMFRKDGSDDIDVRISKGDVFSVTDTIVAEMEKAGDGAKLYVTVRSFEDESRSDPTAEGEPRWEGPYFVGNTGIEEMEAKDAVAELAKLVISPFITAKAVEGYLGNFFLRTKLDALVFCATFNGTDVSLPMANSLHPPKPEAFVRLYRQLQKTASDIMAYALDKFKDELDESAFSGQKKEPKPNEIIAPDRKIVTPEEARKDQVKVVSLV